MIKRTVKSFSAERMHAEIRANSRSTTSRPFNRMSGYVEPEFPHRIEEPDIHTENMLSMEGYVEPEHELSMDDESVGSN